MIRPGLIFLSVVFCAATAGTPVWADDGKKPGPGAAGLVYNLAKFVAWPGRNAADAPAETVFCAVGLNGDAGEFAQLAEKAFRGGPVRFFQPDGPAASRHCDVLYIAERGQDWVGTILDGVNGQPVFTVGSRPGFAAAGGMVELMAMGDTISFRINLAAAKEAGLIIKTPLLQMASIVQPPAP